MNTYLIIFSIFLMCILICLISFLCLMAIKMHRDRESGIAKNKINDLEVEDKPETEFCTDHDSVIAQGSCSIDNKKYCSDCITKVDDIKIAKKNVDEYSNFTWRQILMIKNNNNMSDIMNRISMIKKSFWNKQKSPLIIRSYYKIDIDTDQIEGYTALLCREEDESIFNKELSFIK